MGSVTTLLGCLMASETPPSATSAVEDYRTVGTSRNPHSAALIQEDSGLEWGWRCSCGDEIVGYKQQQAAQDGLTFHTRRRPDDLCANCGSSRDHWTAPGSYSCKAHGGWRRW